MLAPCFLSRLHQAAETKAQAWLCTSERLRTPKARSAREPLHLGIRWIAVAFMLIPTGLPTFKSRSSTACRVTSAST